MKLNPELIGDCPAIRQVKEQMKLYAGEVAPVLIEGEPGVGKELVARGMHLISRRKGRLIKIDCGCLADTVIESELFGHERGAFTGAYKPRTGLLEEATEGTLFLDEVANLQPPHQAKLLQFLQERTFRRIGSNREITLDVKIISASNVPLREAAKAGTFRADLFHRLNALYIYLPPLRERGEDILLLLEHFLQRHLIDCHIIKRWLAEHRERLLGYSWWGNVRELEHFALRVKLWLKSPTSAPSPFLTLADSQPITPPPAG